jgi:hypothetical protein
VSATVFFNSSSELATLTNVFKVNGVATDPSSVTLTVTSPTNVVTTPTPTHSATGTYTTDVTCNEEGTWQALWESTGTATDAEVVTWEVYETDLGKLYCPIEALKSRIGLAESHTTADFELHAACFSASRWVEQYCDRVFYRTTSQARTFEPADWRCLTLGAFNDLVSVTSLKTDTAGDGTYATTWASTDYQLLPYNPAAAPEQRPYDELRAIASNTFPWWSNWSTRRRDTVQITGIWGWPKVPLAVKQATAILATDIFALKDAPFGAEGHADFVTHVGDDGRRFGDNRRATRLLDPYRRQAVLVA